MLSSLAEKISRRAVVMTLALAVAMLVLFLSVVTMPVKPSQALGRLEAGRTSYPGTQLPCPCMAANTK